MLHNNFYNLKFSFLICVVFLNFSFNGFPAADNNRHSAVANGTEPGPLLVFYYKKIK